MPWNTLPPDEKWHTLSHALGLLFFLLGTPMLLYLAWKSGQFSLLVSVCVFMLSAIAMYAASALYHLQINPLKKAKWKVKDHIAIYFLIGGTYTPYIFLFYNNQNGWIFLSVLWGLIFLASLLKYFFIGRYRWASIIAYLALGWMVVLIYHPITINMNDGTWRWLVFGGLAYSVGVIFYTIRRIPYNHVIWHFFVLLGTIAHYISITLGITAGLDVG